MTPASDKSSSARARARARDIVEETGGRELVERLEHLDAHRARRSRQRAQNAGVGRAPDGGARFDFDVAIAGGGLALLIAPLLADRGLRVAVIERGRAGVVHREWNASRPELQPLCEAGLFSCDEIDAMVVNRYRHGTCSWHGGEGSYAVRGVLDCAVDAPQLLREVRARAEARGVTFIDHHSVAGHRAGPCGVRLLVEPRAGGRPRQLSARVMVDARGAASPYAAEADLVCPTVGGVLGGLEEGSAPDQIDPTVGQILATVDDVVEVSPSDPSVAPGAGGPTSRQHIWEAFPGAPGKTTVYLFYYAPSERVADGALLSLYARFFETLPRYKRGAAQVLRPTFGYIPGWSRLARGPAPDEPRVLLVGDAAARHSPLTFCGFGSMLRSFRGAARRVADAVERDDRDGAPLAPAVVDAPIHAGTGALARMMASPPPGAALNGLLDAAFGTLSEMGDAAYGALLRDEMPAREFVAFLHRTSLRRPRVYADVLRTLGAASVGRWGVGLVRQLIAGALPSALSSTLERPLWRAPAAR